MNFRRLKNCVCFLCCLCLLAGSTAFAAYETLEKGDKGSDVLTMQIALSALGYEIEPDGSYGDKTKKIIEQFQKDQDLGVDGRAGNKTLTRLYSLMPSLEPGGGQSGGSGSVSIPARVVTTGGTLTVRKTQSTSSKSLALIPHMTVITVTEKGSKWCKTTYNGQTGYVLTSYLSFDLDATATKKPESVSVNARVVTTGGTLTVRKTQSTSSKGLAYIPHQTVITVTEKGSKWCKTSYNGQTGYVLTSYLNFDLNASVTAAPTKAPSSDATTAQVRTTGGTLTLREKRKTNSAALKLIPNLTLLTVTDRGSTWCTVIYDGAVGYVLTRYLNFNSFIDATPAPNPTATPAPPTNIPSGGLTATVKTTGGTLTLRKTESTGAAALEHIPNKTVITVLETGSKWCKALYNGKTGYVLTSYLVFNSATAAPVPTATAMPTATAVPVPTQTPGYDTSILNRVLRSGYTGQDVTLTQQRLVELKYLSSVSGRYDDATIAAVKSFQSLHNLKVDGLAGSSTFTALFGSGAIPFDPSSASYKKLHIYYGSIDSSLSPYVTKLQTALRDLGYNVTVTGTFAELTHNAVVQFQMRNGLTPDGVAGPAMQTVLYSGKAKGASAAPSYVLPENAGKMSTPANVQLLHWQNYIKPKLPSGSKLLVFDPKTNLSWTLRLYSPGRHADSEPLTLSDTLIMNKAFGATNWTIHPVYVRLPSGEWTMATMHNRPHLTGSISGNGFDGHLCVHFLRDMDEVRKNDPNFGVSNQNVLRSAWKSLTGETVE